MKSHMEQINEIYKRIKEETRNLASINCAEHDCEVCPFNNIKVGREAEKISCGEFVDIFFYNEKEYEEV